MFSVGDIIVYGTQGVCRIDSIQIKQVGKSSCEYFVLKPIFSEKTSLFVPVGSEALTARMQPVLTVREAESIIDGACEAKIIEIEDESKKREEYKNILSSNNRQKLVSLIKTICCEKEARRLCGKKLNINDDQTLRRAEGLLYNELGFVLNVEPAEIKKTINF